MSETKRYYIARVMNDGTIVEEQGKRFLVVDMSEPYAEAVYQAIKVGEKEKNGKDLPDTLEAFKEQADKEVTLFDIYNLILQNVPFISPWDAESAANAVYNRLNNDKVEVKR